MDPSFAAFYGLLRPSQTAPDDRCGHRAAPSLLCSRTSRFLSLLFSCIKTDQPRNHIMPPLPGSTRPLPLRSMLAAPQMESVFLLLSCSALLKVAPTLPAPWFLPFLKLCHSISASSPHRQLCFEENKEEGHEEVLNSRTLQSSPKSCFQLN